MESVYIETSVVGHLTSRLSANLIVAAHQQITREWWDAERLNYHCFISAEVRREIGAGDPKAAQERIAAVQAISVLEPSPEIVSLAEHYFLKLALPPRAKADAFHMAYAVLYQIDYIATWNLTHIANGQVVKMLAEINNASGLFMPTIVTPEGLQSRKAD